MSQLDVESLWIALHQPLLRFVRRRVPDADQAEDIVQEVFVKISGGLGTLRSDEQVRGWAYQIARRAVADYYRSRPPLEPLPPDIVAPAPEHDPQQAFVRRCVIPLLDALPPAAREALLLADVQGLSQHDLALRLGLSFSGTRARVQRARARLRALLERCCDLEFDPHGTPIGCRRPDPPRWTPASDERCCPSPDLAPCCAA